MLENENYEIVKMHIGCFEERKDAMAFNINKYPERLCVFDKNNEIVIDVETCHQYSYVKVLNGRILDTHKLNSDKRVGCMKYAFLPYGELDSKTLKKCESIIKQLKAGIAFPDGNKELTNEQYLEFINTPEIAKKK